MSATEAVTRNAAAPATTDIKDLQTVGDVRSKLRAEQPQSEGQEPKCVCVGGKKLPEDGQIKLADLDIEKDGKAAYCDNDLSPPEAGARPKAGVKLGLERFLTLWILLTVGLGIAIGQIPDIDKAFETLKLGNTNILTAIGMIVMLLPPFASVEYDKYVSTLRTIPRRIAISSLIVNWLIGPFFMLLLGLAVLHDYPDLLQGVVFIGAARCIAMVIVWTALAGGDGFLCVSLVLLNSIITVFMYSPIVFILGIISREIGSEIRSDVSFWTVLMNVLIYLGIPLVLGFTMWAVGRNFPGYRTKFLPRFAPCGLLALLWTILVMFSEMSKPLLSGDTRIEEILLVVVPLLVYFTSMFFGSWFAARWLLKVNYGQNVAFALTAASNNFELALAACTAIFGTSSNQAVATVLGPLIEIPVMLALVNVAKKMYYEDPSKQGDASEPQAQAQPKPTTEEARPAWHTPDKVATDEPRLIGL